MRTFSSLVLSSSRQNADNNNNNNNNNNDKSKSTPNNNRNASKRSFSKPQSSGPSSSSSPWIVPKAITIPEDQIEINFVRSSGSGGQNVNKVNTKVELRLHVMSSNWIGPDEVRRRLVEQQSSRINKDGYLTVTSQEHRTQLQNRKSALAKLSTIILDAWPRPKIRKQRTGISKASKQRNKEFKKKRSEIKQNRKRVDW